MWGVGGGWWLKGVLIRMNFLYLVLVVEAVFTKVSLVGKDGILLLYPRQLDATLGIGCTSHDLK